MTNQKYLKRRQVKFFEGTLEHMNNFENLKKRKRNLKISAPTGTSKQSDDHLLLPSLKKRKLDDQQMNTIKNFQTKVYW